MIEGRKSERFSQTNERDLLGILLNAKEVQNQREKEKKKLNKPYREEQH